MRESAKSKSILGVLLIGLIATFVGCGLNSVSRKEDVSSQISPPQPRSTVILRKTHENKGVRCKARLYDLAPDPDEVVDLLLYNHCRDLQEKLNNAAWDGDLQTIREVLGLGANVNAGYYQEGFPLQMACLKNRPMAVQLLLDNGADPNRISNFGSTALKTAVIEGHPKVVDVLIKNDVDLCSNASDDLGQKQTALEIARDGRKKEIIELLEKAGGADCSS